MKKVLVMVALVMVSVIVSKTELKPNKVKKK